MAVDIRAVFDQLEAVPMVAVDKDVDATSDAKTSAYLDTDWLLVDRVHASIHLVLVDGLVEQTTLLDRQVVAQSSGLKATERVDKEFVKIRDITNIFSIILVVLFIEFL